MNSGHSQPPLCGTVDANLVLPARSGTPSVCRLVRLGFFLVHFSHISNLKSPPQPFPRSRHGHLRVFHSTSGRTRHPPLVPRPSSLATSILPNLREYRLFGTVLSDNRRQAPALIGHSPVLSVLALVPSQTSNLKSRIPFAFCLHPLAFRTILPATGKIPPISQNIPPYPRISPLKP